MKSLIKKEMNFMGAVSVISMMVYSIKFASCLAWAGLSCVPGLQGFAFGAVGVFWGTVASIANPIAGIAVGL